MRENSWKGFILGALGSLCGLLAMRAYWQRAAPQVNARLENPSEEGQEVQESQALEAYEDISIYGQQYREGESSTAALGRFIYRWFTGKDPQTQETKTLLSYLVHWGYGALQGGLYGALRSKGAFPGLRGGLAYAAGLWLIGDEFMVPLLGLQEGPGSVSLAGHANRLGAHLAFGAGSSLAVGVLAKIF